MFRLDPRRKRRHHARLGRSRKAKRLSREEKTGLEKTSISTKRPNRGSVCPGKKREKGRGGCSPQHKKTRMGREVHRRLTGESCRGELCQEGKRLE